jgi:ADP-ribosyl-[dinitrogen reductase] hydrolase
VTTIPAKRIRASVMASAVGDALGAPTEFQSREAIDARVGVDGVRSFLDPTGGHITDDTQMLLFTAEAMLRARAHYRVTGTLDAVLSCAYRAYLRWLQTQKSDFYVAERLDKWMHEADATPSLLLADPLMHVQRAPGRTCLDSLSHPRAPGTRSNILNNSKGCGTVMRISPVGMVFRDLDDTTVYQLGVDVSAITHSHPTGYLAGGAMALIVKALVNGGRLDDAVNSAMIQLGLETEHDAYETMQAIANGYAMGCSKSLSVHMLDGLGGGWVAEEALSIAIAATAACKGNTMDAIAMCAAINGDSDSVASMAGTLCGALYGVDEQVTMAFEQLHERRVFDHISDLFADS